MPRVLNWQNKSLVWALSRILCQYQRFSNLCWYISYRQLVLSSHYLFHQNVLLVHFGHFLCLICLYSFFDCCLESINPPFLKGASSVWQFYTGFQSCIGTCSKSAITEFKVMTPLEDVRIYYVQCIYIKKKIFNSF